MTRRSPAEPQHTSAPVNTAEPLVQAGLTCMRSVMVGHRALQMTFFTTSGSRLAVMRRMMLSQAGPLDSICMKT